MTASTSIVRRRPRSCRNRWWPCRSPPKQHAGAQHQQQVADDRPGDRRLDDLELPGGEREERDDELRDIAEGGVEHTAHLGTGERPETLRRGAHDIGEAQDPRGADHEDGRALDPDHPLQDDRHGAHDERPDEHGTTHGREVAEHGDRVHGRALGVPGSRNRSRRGRPVSRATSRAASLRAWPAATSAATRRCPSARSTPAWGPAGRCRLGHTRDHDGHLAPWRVHPGLVGERAQPAAPHLLVELGQLPAQGRRSVRTAGLGKVRQGRCGPAGRLEQDRRAVVRAMRASRSRRSAPLRGRNPSNAQRGAGMPLAMSAASTADGPGMGTTAPPSAAQALTSSPPGSLTRGVPASVTSATSSPARSRARSSASAPLVTLRVEADQRRADVGARPQLPGDPRVLGRHHRDGAQGRDGALVMSPRWPMGVATTYSVPRPSGTPAQPAVERGRRRG